MPWSFRTSSAIAGGVGDVDALPSVADKGQASAFGARTYDLVDRTTRTSAPPSAQFSNSTVPPNATVRSLMLLSPIPVD